MYQSKLSTACFDFCLRNFEASKDFLLEIITVDLKMQIYENILKEDTTTAISELGKIRKTFENRKQRTNFLLKRLRKDRYYILQKVDQYVKGTLTMNDKNIHDLFELLESGYTFDEIKKYLQEKEIAEISNQLSLYFDHFNK